MTLASLREKPVRDLARLAKQHGVAGWHAMRKDQLIRALVRKAKARQTVPAAAHSAAAVLMVQTMLKRSVPTVSTGSAASRRQAVISQRIQEAREHLAKAKNLATARPETSRSSLPRDKIVLMVRGPHWLHAFWEVTPRSIARAQAALGQEWHGARPVLRVLEIENGMQASSSERVNRDIDVHGGVKNWFIDVRNPLRCRVEIGYLAASGRFQSLARSNTVSTPSVPHGDTLDAHWGEIVGDSEKIYAMSGGFSTENNSSEIQELFEERLKRPMGPPTARRASVDNAGLSHPTGTSPLEVEAEMIIYGVTQVGSYVTLQGEPVKVQPDGTFRIRVDLPNKRQVLPLVASTADGVEQQTVVIAIERNTKIMEPFGRESLI